MTTPPQGPWGPGQPGGQPGGQQGGRPQGGRPGQGQPPQGGGGWQQPGQPQGGQPPAQPYPPTRPPQGQPPHGQPPHGQPPQQGRPPQYGQQPPQQGQPGGWGQQPPQGPPPQYGQQPPYGQQPGYQQPWGQQQPQGGWQQGQQPWQGGPGRKRGGISKDKLPLLVGGSLIGLVVIALVVFLGIHFLGDDDKTTTTSPSTQPTQSAAGGQAQGATDKLQSAGFQCSDLFNGAQGAHRGCFKFDEVSQAEVIFQFQADGTIVSTLIRSMNRENVNNAAVSFDAALQAIGNDTFGGSDVAKIQAAVKTGQKDAKVDSTWGDFTLFNNGDSVQISGRKSGMESFDLPTKEFSTTVEQMTTALKAKQYACTLACRKDLGRSGSQRIFPLGGSSKAIRSLDIEASGDPAEVKAAIPVAIADALGVLKGPDVEAIKTFLAAHTDGKPYAAYVAGWRIEQTGTGNDDYSSQSIRIKYESYYV
ncbi:hypothetical protein GCM10009554_01850 [Kribbella koreensis]|uniref:Uncharacterized protein n=1 Tax=Kribbella koreensis TaxID=57909 RepID=A0ABP3ZKM5_9ACTN